MIFYYTFGTEEQCPFKGGWVEVEAETIRQANSIFRSKYPDRVPGVLNCACYYNDVDFELSGMKEKGNFGEFCHQRLKTEEKERS